jgi:hypothetical protein
VRTVSTSRKLRRNESSIVAGVYPATDSVEHNGKAEMSNLIADWKIHCDDIENCALAIFETANVPITEKGFADPKYLALTLLARTVSNLKGAKILLDAKRIIEARTITRCCLENFYWTIGLTEQGEAFVQQMRDDEFSRRKAIGQEIFDSATLDQEVQERFRTFMRNVNKDAFGKKTLNPKAVAQIRNDFSRTYMFYSQLSSDSAHPSVTALNRYVVVNPTDGHGFDTEPLVKTPEIVQTYEYLSMACLGVCIGVNQVIGWTEGGKRLNAIADRYNALSNASKAEESGT